MIDYELSVGSNCNSLKTNQVFKKELGCPRAINYLTPPPLAIFWGDATYKKIECPRAIRNLKNVFFWFNYIELF